MHPTRRGSLMIMTAALFWSTGGFFIKSVSLDAFGISLWRSSLAAITLYIFYRINFANSPLTPDTRNLTPVSPPTPDTRHPTPVSPPTPDTRYPIPDSSDWYSLRTLSTAIVYSALLVLFVLATKLTTSANAIFLQYTAPVYVLFFDPIISKTKIKLADIIAVLITIAAMGLFFVGKFDTTSVAGNLLALLSGVCFAAYSLLLKHEKTSERMRWQSVIVGHLTIVAVMLILTVTGNAVAMPKSMTEVGMLAFLGVLQIGLPYALFTKGIHHVRALDALLISMLEPVLNPIWVYFGVGETPSQYAMIGGAIILAVVLIRTFLEGRNVEVTMPVD